MRNDDSPQTCCGGGGDCATVFEPCPCNSPVWKRSWSTFDLPSDLWRSSTCNGLGCARRCRSNTFSAAVLLIFRLLSLSYCVVIWAIAYRPGTELRLANDLESFTMQVCIPAPSIAENASI